MCLHKRSRDNSKVKAGMNVERKNRYASKKEQRVNQNQTEFERT